MSNKTKRSLPVVFRDTLMANADKIAEVANRHVDVNRLIKIFTVAASHNPKLYECTTISIISTAMTAAELGLTVGGSLGHIYPVPYGKECVPIIGYRGLITLALRTGKIVTIEARNVYENDVFEIEYNKEVPFVHKPVLRSADRGEYIGSYCVSRTRDGFVQFTWMDADEISKIRKRSKAKKDSPWRTDFGEMCRKTVTRRHIKYLDLTGDVAEMITTAEEAEMGLYRKDVTPKPLSVASNDAASKVREKLGITEPDVQEEPEEADLGEVVDTETGEVLSEPEELSLDIEEEAGWHGEQA